MLPEVISANFVEILAKNGNNSAHKLTLAVWILAVYENQYR
jgi:hypothetical protein